MNLALVRVTTNEQDTVGVLMLPAPHAWCYTLEDPDQDQKIPGRTRIPQGYYEIKLRREGGMHARYAKRFGPMHRGMLHLQNVPGFEWIQLHCGNTAGDTEGCPLLGEQVISYPDGNRLLSSVSAYKRIYPPVAAAIERGEATYLRVVDE